MEYQIIHADLAGNILFDDFENPFIIDFSPDYKPAIYAEVLLVTDSIAWHNESLLSFEEIICDRHIKTQLILRAVIFRLCVPLFFDSNNENDFWETYEEFKPILKYLKLT